MLAFDMTVNVTFKWNGNKVCVCLHGRVSSCSTTLATKTPFAYCFSRLSIMKCKIVDDGVVLTTTTINDNNNNTGSTTGNVSPVLCHLSLRPTLN